MRNLLRKLAGSSSPASADTADRLRPGRDVLSTEHEGAAVLLDLRRNVYLSIDEVGTTIWREIERGSSCAEIEHALQEQYDADAEVLRRDSRAFIGELLSRRLVVVA